MNGKKQVLGILTAGLCMLMNASGCNVNDTDKDSNEIKDDDQIHAEGIAGYNLGLSGHMVPSGTGDGTLYVNTTVSSMNPPDQTEPVLLCVQAGCTHSDETCKAYIGNTDYFLSYHDVWYYTVSESNNRLTLHSYDYKSGKRSVLHTWEGSEQESVAVDNMLADHNKLYVSLYTASYSPEENMNYGNSKTDCIDLDQNTCVTVLESEEKEKWFAYCHNGKIIYTYTYLNSELPDFFEWIEQGKSEEEYSELLNRMTISELHLLDTGNSKDIVLGTDIAFPGVNAYSYDQFVWHDSDRLYLYNIDLGTTESIEVPGIIHSEVFDRHILFITRSADEKTGLYVTDTKDMKQITEIESVGLNDHITFSIIFETENGFFGIYNDALCWIKKTDYYQGSFEKSVYMGAI